MDVSVKFNQEELKLIHEAIRLGIIHVDNDSKSDEMVLLIKKIELLIHLQNNNI